MTAFGIRFPAPLVLAAGFDKNAEHLDGLLGLGFGGVEIGTVTARAQPGNPRPRLFRLPADRALINRMGFNNEGADAVERRLAAWREHGRRRGGIVGVNLGKSKATPAEEAAADYRYTAGRLGPYADYVVVNVSSPNTPGLRALQARERLAPILDAVRGGLDEAGREGIPVLVKIAPDLEDAEIDELAALAVDAGLAGVIATNTTIRRDGLSTSPARIAAIGDGGLSGAPLRERSLAVLDRLVAALGGQAAVVSAGGVEHAGDVTDRLRRGAALVQAYSGFVYGGPLWPRRVVRGLPERLPGRVSETAAGADGPDPA